MIKVETQGNIISASGVLGLSDYKRLLATIYNIADGRGFEDFGLDLSGLTAAFAGPMLAVAADIARHRLTGRNVSVIFPSDDKLYRLFRNAGWLKLLSPSEEAAASHANSQHVPAVSFVTSDDQFEVTNRLIDAVLASLPGLTRSDLAALEWAINEVSDNVLVHSESEVGGFVQLSAFPDQRRIELAVADAGVGIPETLRQALPELRPDSRALEQAVVEGVTRSKAIGRGNGLFGTMEIARVSEGYIHIHSGYGRLRNEHADLRLANDKVPFHGTLVVVSLDCSDPGALGRALRFDGEKYDPPDIIDTRYTTEDEEDILFLIARDAPSIGSRGAGEAFRTKVENLLGMRPDSRLVLDFTGVVIISSSFADEVIGKLFTKLGPLGFMRRVVLKGLSPAVNGLIERALRMRTIS
jgi:anti-sigma regulatory factor (Ser/Thr protein kinase)